MRRRTKVGIAIGLVAAVAAVAPWTVQSERLAGAVSRQLEAAYGAGLRVKGRTSIALLPVPRVKFARASIVMQDGTELVRDAQIKGELRLLPLLVGRLDLDGLSIAGGSILVHRDAGSIAPWLASAAGAGTRAGAPSLRRIVVSGSDLVLRDTGGVDTVAKGLALVASWPTPSSALDVVGSASWRGEIVEASLAIPRPAGLLAGRSEALDATLTARHAKASFSGQAEWRDGLRLVGQGAVAMPSMAALARWLGHAGAPASLDRPLGLKGEARLEPGRLDLSGIALDLGRDRLEGALSLGFSPRWAAQATLAAGTLDLGWLAEALSPTIRAWAETGAVPFASAAGLDLRLSAAELRLGALAFGDGAASLLVSGDRVEATLLRAAMEGGVVKGRLAAELDGPRRHLKAQASWDNVEAGPVLAALGWPAIVTGRATGQSTLDAAADPGASLLRHLGGRVALTLRRGNLSGLDLATAFRRADLRPAATPPWRAARTGFDQAQIGLTLANGVAEIVEGSIDGAAIRATLEGRVSLPDRFVSLRATATPNGGAGAGAPSGIVLDMNGPWGQTTTLPGPGPALPIAIIR